MIIVSQDAKSIYNFDNIKSIDILKNEIYITDDILADEGALIGRYKTKERAKEVLEEITENYATSIDYMYNQTLLIRELEEYKESLIYRMPKE